jgi:hypothetical protein
MNVTEWLRSLGLEQYAPAFEDNHVSSELLPSLTADDLKELGIASVSHRRVMLDAIAGLRARRLAAGIRRGFGRRASAADGDVLRSRRLDGPLGSVRPGTRRG